jgi:hypothetical protein
MATFKSPNVVISEADLSQYITNQPTSTGVQVIRAKRGQVIPRFVTSVRQFKEMYTSTQRRIDKDYVEQYSAVAFLEVGYSGLWIVRAVGDNAKYAYVIINKSDATQGATIPATGLTVASDRTGPVFPSWDTLGENAVMIVYCKSPGAIGNNFSVVVKNVSATNKTFELIVTETLPDGSTEVRFGGVVSLDPDARDGYGNNIWVKNVLGTHEYIGAEVNPSAYNLVPKEITTPVGLAGGVDADPTVGNIGSAYDQFSDREVWDIDLLIQGGIGDDTIRAKLVDIAEKRGDAVALIDVPQDKYKVEDIKSWRQTNFNVASSYGMAFAPWLKTYDFDNDVQLFIPPSGVVAGMMAKVDREYDPWWVPAGLNRGRVNVLGLQAYYSLAERDELDGVQVNCFVRKPGVIALWNNRTLQAPETYFSFIEVRRLTNYIKKNVCKVLDAFLFEPLTDFTRERLVATLKEFMDSIQRRMGVLKYAVISDPLGTGNNPPAQVDQGILTVEVFYVPVRAIRGIWLKAIVTRFGYQIEERVGGM